MIIELERGNLSEENFLSIAKDLDSLTKNIYQDFLMLNGNLEHYSSRSQTLQGNQASVVDKYSFIDDRKKLEMLCETMLENLENKIQKVTIMKHMRLCFSSKYLANTADSKNSLEEEI